MEIFQHFARYESLVSKIALGVVAVDEIWTIKAKNETGSEALICEGRSD